MNKNILIILGLSFLAIVLIFVFYFADNSSGSETASGGLVLFYSDTCPHCLVVEKFLEENKVYEKVSYVRKNIDNNSKNVSELKQKASICNINDGIGIPFLWNGESSTCLMGDIDIIDFFKERIN